MTPQTVALKLITVIAMTDLLKDDARKHTLLDGVNIAEMMIAVGMVDIADKIADEAGALGLLFMMNEGHTDQVATDKLIADQTVLVYQKALEANAAKHQAARFEREEQEARNPEKTADPFNGIRFDQAPGKA